MNKKQQIANNPSIKPEVSLLTFKDTMAELELHLVIEEVSLTDPRFTIYSEKKGHIIDHGSYDNYQTASTFFSNFVTKLIINSELINQDKSAIKS